MGIRVTDNSLLHQTRPRDFTRRYAERNQLHFRLTPRLYEISAATEVHEETELELFSPPDSVRLEELHPDLGSPQDPRRYPDSIYVPRIDCPQLFLLKSVSSFRVNYWLITFVCSLLPSHVTSISVRFTPRNRKMCGLH